MQQQLTAVCGKTLADEMRINLSPEDIIQRNLCMGYVLSSHKDVDYEL